MTSYTMSLTKRAQCKSLVIRGFHQSKWGDARTVVILTSLADRQGITPYGLGLRRLMADKLCTGFQKKGVMDSNSERQPSRGGERSTSVNSFSLQSSPHRSFLPDFTWKKKKFPVGSGREGNTTGSWVALGHAPLPSNPRWWPEGKQLEMYYLTEASIQQEGGSPNHCWFGFGTQARMDQRG